MRDESNSVGIKNIAKALNISIGTVDRALHGRRGVSEKTKARVLQVAEQLGYKPNLAAQALKRNRRISIGVVLPRHISYFFDPLRSGIRAAEAAAIGSQVSLEFHEYPRIGIGDTDSLEAAYARKYDGIIFLPGDIQRFSALIRKISRNGTAMMCVGSDAPDTGRVGSVSIHAYVSGAIAAELLAHKLPRKANVAILTGELSTLDHAEKLSGFAATLAVQAPHLTLLPTLEGHEKPKEAYRQALTLMRRKDRPEGLYLSTANSMAVLEALEELGLLGKVQVIATDLFQDLVTLIRADKVLATLYQRPFTQGKLAFEHLVAHLMRSEPAPPVVRLAPHIVLRSNLQLFANQVSGTDDETDVEFDTLT
jgi:LacI family transcriptional regulator